MFNVDLGVGLSYPQQATDENWTPTKCINKYSGNSYQAKYAYLKLLYLFFVSFFDIAIATISCSRPGPTANM